MVVKSSGGGSLLLFFDCRHISVHCLVHYYAERLIGFIIFRQKLLRRHKTFLIHSDAQRDQTHAATEWIERENVTVMAIVT